MCTASKSKSSLKNSTGMSRLFLTTADLLITVSTLLSGKDSTRNITFGNRENTFKIGYSSELMKHSLGGLTLYTRYVFIENERGGRIEGRALNLVKTTQTT